MDNQAIIRRALKSLFEAYRGLDSEFVKYFSRDYVQWANGKITNFDQLIAHFDKLGETRPNRKIAFIDMVSEGDIVFDQHVVTATLSDEDVIQVDVFAKWTVKNGLITRCEELTRQREGSV
ncbi:SnoaL-like protein [Trinickia symbiotica]|uniref:Nuclear transport factor 2 family protein n=1 Tax=Trinickia symbiotica TaxID=863227 RepID=A0A2N7WT25_9BURK|nr:nuclear transport factor 2 family protein [Trinickia symbiotica]PMS32628.1 nuclear transport factor 2 family protein [Trinickia symbiotica]PPK41009.1 SnoaL-like protein [Trinickia symbiotica]